MSQNNSSSLNINPEKIPPVIFLYGDEDFLLQRYADSLLKSLLIDETASFNFDLFDGETAKIEIILDVCRQFPMMSSRRVVYLKNIEKVFSLKSKKDAVNHAFENYLLSPPDTTVLIISCSENIKASKSDAPGFPYNILLGSKIAKKFTKLNDSEMPEWIDSEFISRGKKISSDASRYLSTISAPNLREISAEIDKICLFAADKSEIDLGIITEIAGHSKEYNVFELQKEVGRRNTAKAIEIMQRILSVNRHETLIVGTLAKYFMNLMKISDEVRRTQNKAEIAKTAGVPYFFIDEYLSAVRKFSQSELENAFYALAYADRTLKSSQIDSIFLLEELLIKIAG